MLKKTAKGSPPLGVQGSAIAADTAWDDRAPLQSLGRQGLPHWAPQADGSVGCVWLWRGGQWLLRAAGRPLPLVVVAAEGELVFEGAAVAAASLVFWYGHPIELRTAPVDGQEGHFVREASVSCVRAELVRVQIALLCLGRKKGLIVLIVVAFEITCDANGERSLSDLPAWGGVIMWRDDNNTNRHRSPQKVNHLFVRQCCHCNFADFDQSASLPQSRLPGVTIRLHLLVTKWNLH